VAVDVPLTLYKKGRCSYSKKYLRTVEPKLKNRSSVADLRENNIQYKIQTNFGKNCKSLSEGIL